MNYYVSFSCSQTIEEQTFTATTGGYFVMANELLTKRDLEWLRMWAASDVNEMSFAKHKGINFLPLDVTVTFWARMAD